MNLDRATGVGNQELGRVGSKAASSAQAALQPDAVAADKLVDPAEVGPVVKTASASAKKVRTPNGRSGYSVASAGSSPSPSQLSATSAPVTSR